MVADGGSGGLEERQQKNMDSIFITLQLSEEKKNNGGCSGTETMLQKGMKIMLSLTKLKYSCLKCLVSTV